MLVSHQLRHLSNLYGTFATVLGLIWWLALGSIVTVYASEFNVVVTRHLWPRSLRDTGDQAGGDDGPEGREPEPLAAGGATGHSGLGQRRRRVRPGRPMPGRRPAPPR